MKNSKKLFLAALLLAAFSVTAQRRPAASAAIKNPIAEAIVKEGNDNSQLEKLATELMDGIGPRLVGTPEMKQAGDWAIATYNKWGIAAKTEKWGEWQGWQRGVSHIDMTFPRAKSLEGMQLAWSPGTNGKTVEAEVMILPYLEDSLSFAKWLPASKGKIILISMSQPTGRPDYNWEEFGTKESVEKMKKDREVLTASWNKRISNSGYNARTLPAALEKAGAVGVVTCNWSRGFGVNKIFGAYTKNVPSVDISVEDYGLLYRLAEAGIKPKMALKIDSKMLPPTDAFNIVGELKGVEKPNEYVMLPRISIHEMEALVQQTTALAPL